MTTKGFLDPAAREQPGLYHDSRSPSPWGAQRPPLSQASSSYHDRPSPYFETASQSSYFGNGSRMRGDLEPWDTTDSIPLSGRKAKHESTHTIAPILPHPPEDEPYIRDIDSGDYKRRTGVRKWFNRDTTWMVWILSFIELVVFIAELGTNGVLTQTPIEIHPSFNPMIGPSPYVLINMGARYQPCMHSMPGIQNSTTPIYWPCPNATSTTGSSVSCSLSDLCGFGGVPNPQVASAGADVSNAAVPNQWWRFIVPIFIHAGIVHIGFNLLLQLTLGRDVEKLIGSVRFTLVYFASGIFGFVLGGNFAADGIASCGCSGSLFGLLAITLVDLLYTWRTRPSPWKDLLFMIVDMAIAFVLGLLPGLDNFSHIGGFLMGLVLGICLLRSPAAIAGRRDVPGGGPIRTPYPSDAGVDLDPSAYHATASTGLGELRHDPRGFFAGRRGRWWAWWVLRVTILVGVIVGFILLLKNFYVWRTTCGWCKYLSCLPIRVGGTNWCDVGNLSFNPQTPAGGG